MVVVVETSNQQGWEAMTTREATCLFENDHWMNNSSADDILRVPENYVLDIILLDTGFFCHKQV